MGTQLEILIDAHLIGRNENEAICVIRIRRFEYANVNKKKIPIKLIARHALL